MYTERDVTFIMMQRKEWKQLLTSSVFILQAEAAACAKCSIIHAACCALCVGGALQVYEIYPKRLALLDLTTAPKVGALSMFILNRI